MSDFEPFVNVDLVAFVVVQSGDAGGGKGFAVDCFVEVAVVCCSPS